MKSEKAYVHGYDARENLRLQDQATTLSELLHNDTCYPPGSRVLEAGCGVGSQTIFLAEGSPDAYITAIDISRESLTVARRRVSAAGFSNVTFEHGDIFDLSYGPELFDHVFVCFVLEHLPNPVKALVALKTMIRKGGTITVVEGDHGSVYFHPDSEYAHRAIRCQIELQKRAGGNACIGRELFPLLKEAGLDKIGVSPRMVYVDSSRPGLVEGFTKNTFTAMIEGIRDSAVDAGLMRPVDIDRGIKDLYRTAEADGVFCYTFFKAVAVKK
jgi:SAM-dependent methyltransferase